MRNISTPKYIKDIFNLTNSVENLCVSIQKEYKQIINDIPDVSIVIPAYNEEKNILKTLIALVNNKSKYKVEIIVVNNNSTDRTEEFVNKSGIKCILEKVPGITAARNAGLNVARGKFILNADADTILPNRLDSK
jgi:glycosyltransferase involved in cell wall biosynthesis